MIKIQSLQLWKLCCPRFDKIFKIPSTASLPSVVCSKTITFSLNVSGLGPLEDEAEVLGEEWKVARSKAQGCVEANQIYASRIITNTLYWELFIPGGQIIELKISLSGFCLRSLFWFASKLYFPPLSESFTLLICLIGENWRWVGGVGRGIRHFCAA